MDVPSTQDVSDIIIAQLEGSLAQTIPILPKAFLRVLAKVLSGVFILLWKYAGFIFLQLFVEEATMQPTTINGVVRQPLVDWGRLIKVSDPVPATAAQHTISVTVTNQTGTLAAGAQLVDSGSGVIHQTVAPVTLNAPTVQVNIVAVSDQNGGDGSGTIGNLDPGDTLNFANPLPNVASSVTIVTRLIDGADAETPASYRARVLSKFRAQPQGGAYADYREWGLTVPGVVNIYPYAGAPGVVDIYVEVSTSLNADGIPDSTILSEVLNAVNFNDGDGLATRRPVNAAPNPLAITRTTFDVNITNLDAPDGTLADVENGLTEYFLSREPFIVGLSTFPREDRITRAAVSGIVDTIVSAVGGSVSAVDLLSGGVSIPSHTLAKGEKAKLGTVTPI
jgi:phage-related baseplate assembly protein